MVGFSIELCPKIPSTWPGHFKEEKYYGVPVEIRSGLLLGLCSGMTTGINVDFEFKTELKLLPWKPQPSKALLV